MTHRMRLGLSAAIIAVIILVSFALSVPHTRDVGEKRVLEPVRSAPVVMLRDSYKKGTHTLSGSVEATNACASATASAAVDGDATSSMRILVTLSLVPSPGVCLELPTPVPFETSVTAPAGVPVAVTVDGVLASTTAP